MFEGKRVTVIGLGKSGLAAAKLCARRGAKVTANDAKSAEALGTAAAELTALGIELRLGGHEGLDLGSQDLVVVSPGVPSFAALDAAEQAGVPVVSEVELSVQSLKTEPEHVVAVGGTNGKSTVTSLLGAFFTAAGARTFVGGNLGEPLSEQADRTFDVVVLEVSSFQMERVRSFKPRAALLLNITDDHLDRYPDFAAYAHAKGNAFARQTEEDFAIVPVGDAVCLEQAKRGQGRVVTFGAGGDVDVRSDAIVDTRSGEVYPRKELSLQGGHNALNVAAAIAAGGALRLPADVMRDVLVDFPGLPHRMAFVRTVRSVRYYDDSKGTNVGASVTALLGVSEPKVVLIAGGKDKGGSYTPLVEALKKKGRAAVLLGEAAPLLRAAIGDSVPVHIASSMEDAVRLAASLAHKGDAVLLSPACSSFDMFADYKERGDVFVRAVRALEEKA
jgi:UDP-N-acetylmuramoylalanine--D-glutamate ligase